jgi:hypothetical protein
LGIALPSQQIQIQHKHIIEKTNKKHPKTGWMMFDQTTYLKKLGYALKILPMLEVTLRRGEAVVQLSTESPALVRTPPPPWEKAKGCQ